MCLLLPDTVCVLSHLILITTTWNIGTIITLFIECNLKLPCNSVSKVLSEQHSSMKSFAIARSYFFWNLWWKFTVTFLRRKCSPDTASAVMKFSYLLCSTSLYQIILELKGWIRENLYVSKFIYRQNMMIQLELAQHSKAQTPHPSPTPKEKKINPHKLSCGHYLFC